MVVGGWCRWCQWLSCDFTAYQSPAKLKLGLGLARLKKPSYYLGMAAMHKVHKSFIVRLRQMSPIDFWQKKFGAAATCMLRLTIFEDQKKMNEDDLKNEDNLKYQPSGAWGTCSPFVMLHCLQRRRGSEKILQSRKYVQRHVLKGGGGPFLGMVD